MPASLWGVGAGVTRPSRCPPADLRATTPDSTADSMPLLQSAVALHPTGWGRPRVAANGDRSHACGDRTLIRALSGDSSDVKPWGSVRSRFVDGRSSVTDALTLVPAPKGPASAATRKPRAPGTAGKASRRPHVPSGFSRQCAPTSGELRLPHSGIRLCDPRPAGRRPLRTTQTGNVSGGAVQSQAKVDGP